MNFQNLVDYGQGFGIDVLGGVEIPDALNVETLKSLIMIRCGLQTPLYSEPQTMADAIGKGFNGNAWGIRRIISLSQSVYDPLENYRRHESASGSSSATGGRTVSRSRDESETIEDVGNIDDSYTNETEKKVSAFNESDYSPESQTGTTGSNNRDIDNSRTRGTKENIIDTENNNKSETDSRTATIYGNIGTMTTQEMFNQEIDLLDRFNPYEWIVDRMEHELFLQMW